MPEIPVNIFLIWIGLQLLTAILKGIEAWYTNKEYYEREQLWTTVREKILPPLIIIAGVIGAILYLRWISTKF
jgi:hypothetical protein